MKTSPQTSKFQYGVQDRQRLDEWLAGQMNESRSAIRKAVKEGRVRLNGAVVRKPGQQLTFGDGIEWSAPQPIDLTPVDMPLDILYEDDWLLVVNKPAGLLVHAATPCDDATLVNGLLAHTTLSPGTDYFRPGIVHRLDKDTSGALLVAKDMETHAQLAEDFGKHKVLRRYLTLVHGCLPFAFKRVDAPIARITGHPYKREINPAGRPAVSDIDALICTDEASLAAVRLWTGRTHQVRVHMASLGHPCIGDWAYAPGQKAYGFQGQALHSWQLQFFHPQLNQWISIFAPPPPHFCQIIDKLLDRQEY